MPRVNRIIVYYLGLTDDSQASRTVVYGLTAFIFIFGLDLVWHYLAGWGWFGQTFAADMVEAGALGIVAAYLSRLREERLLRRHRQVRYLNHHVRNALAVVQMLEQQLEEKQAVTLHQASHRIRTVIEQLSRDENVSINEEAPATYTKKAAA